MMTVSDAQRQASDRYDKKNFEYITFKARKGSKERIKQAAQAQGSSTNGFIRGALNCAVIEATGAPMEPASEEPEATKKATK